MVAIAHENVGWFDIAVDDSLLMGKLECFGQLGEYSIYFSYCQRSYTQPTIQGAIFDIRSDEEVP
jgi:hypothetical protein